MTPYLTPSGMRVTRHSSTLDYHTGLSHLVPALDQQRGMYLSSGIEYPGRYTRFDFGFVNPPIELIAIGRNITVNALNPRGEILLNMLTPFLVASAAVKIKNQTSRQLLLGVESSTEIFPEEQRSRQPTVFTPLQTLTQELSVIEDSTFGLYGAFGYELIFQFDPIKLAHARQGDEKVYHLYLVDDVLVMDRRKEISERLHLEWSSQGLTTQGADTTPFNSIKPMPQKTKIGNVINSNVTDEQYGQLVDKAKERMRVGDIFEVVLSRLFQVDFTGPTSLIYEKMKVANPSPYEFYCQFGDEQLVGTSPEMFVRVDGDKRIESCPISGTIRRGKNAMEDEANIRTLLNSYKDEVELTMCTDVDRNDKSRICEPDSVKLLARRTIERYVGLFHTVDHVEGKLRPEFNGLDGFLSHMWAVTLTGAPKKNAVQIIEDMEGMSRRWYGGSVGRISFNTEVNSCITIRTIHFKNEQAYYRVGATMVWDSVGSEEANETHMKSTPFRRALGLEKQNHVQISDAQSLLGQGYHAIMIDNEDSFVHTLASYFRQCGMTVTTYRAGITVDEIVKAKPDLVIHSPGPGWPKDFGVPELIRALSKHRIPQFGVCLGLQGMVEAFGGQLKLLGTPHHGKTWQLTHQQHGVMAHLPQHCKVAAYHSIVMDRAVLPDELEVIAENENGEVMALRHRHLPIQAVQFHPESILSMEQNVGMEIIRSVIRQLVIKDNS
jgi:anthranilate synthase